jgi:DNA invertase Pin-like site-specific DNA recombinase
MEYFNTFSVAAQLRRALAEKERRLIGELTKAALRAAKARGGALGGLREQSK